MIGTLVRSFNESVRGYFSPTRRDICFPVKVSIEPDKASGSLRKRTSGAFLGFEEIPSLAGESKNLSEGGIAFVVPSIRIGSGYLVGDEKVLKIELSLPNGRVRFQATGKRYEQFDLHSSVSQFLIGAKIIAMSERDRETYLSYISSKGLQIIPRKDSVEELVLNLPR